MTKYTVAVKGEGDAEMRSTDDLDDALDWFTNACTEVMSADADLEFASLVIDGVVHGVINAAGIDPDDHVLEMKAA